MKFIDDETLEKILYGIIILQLFIILFVVIFKEDKDNSSNTNNDIVAALPEEKEIIEDKEEENITKISVDVKGAVKKEGVYELDSGARVNDAIKAAGGLKSNASTKYLNLSKKISDETVIKVYTENQIKNMNITYEVKEECECPKAEIIDCAGSSIIEDSSDDKEEVKDNISSENKNDDQVSSDNNVINEIDNKVSINTGTKEELMTLNGIGEAKALAIIEYRNSNNGFKVLEDIMNVSGIGEAAFNKIKDNIKL